MNKPVVRDGALLLLRAVLGLVFIARGWDRLFLTGITPTTGQFSAWGIPQPEISAWIVSVAELVGGALLVVGLVTTFVAGALAVLVALAAYFVHFGSGFFVTDGGIEYPLVLIAALLIVVVFGSGRASIDGVLVRA